MARTKEEEAIVEGDDEIRRGKRVNDFKYVRPTKKAKVEGNNDAELPICIGDKAEGEAATLCDGELNTSTGETTKDGNAASNDEVNRLSGLLADDPKNLSKKDVEDVIRFLKVDEIVSLALTSCKGQEKESDDGDTEEEEEEWINEYDPSMPCPQKILDVLRVMVCYIEIVKEADFRLLYDHLPHLAFATLILTGMDSYSSRWCGGVPMLKEEDRLMIPQLCHVLPWKLFAHIMSNKTSLHLCKPEKTSEESYVEKSAVLEEATESCEICLRKGEHSGHSAYELIY